MALTAASPIADFRKAYLKLSIRVHPDKNGGSGEAKLAFQHLVFALERLSQPGGAASGKSAGGGSSSAAAAPRQRVDTAALNPRSNEGCVQHKILCPRCGMDWPRKELGLEDAAYNFFMSALKEYSEYRSPRNAGSGLPSLSLILSLSPIAPSILKNTRTCALPIRLPPPPSSPQ